MSEKCDNGALRAVLEAFFLAKTALNGECVFLRQKKNNKCPLHKERGGNVILFVCYIDSLRSFCEK